MNREIPRDVALSGLTYVAARLKEESGGNLDKLVLASPSRCSHVNRICKDCAHLWAIDYHLFYDRTAGGRKLKAELGK